MCAPTEHLTDVFLSPPANSPRGPIQISYIPSHLYHMVFELFKVINDIRSAQKNTNKRLFSLLIHLPQAKVISSVALSLDESQLGKSFFL